jgi:hypothetical protein
MERKARRMSQWPQVGTVDSTVRDCLSRVRIDGSGAPLPINQALSYTGFATLAFGFGCHSAAMNKAVIDREGIVRRSAEDKKKPCKNCEGKGTLKKGDKIVRCQRCGGTGIKPS